MQNQINYHYARIDTKRDLKNENQARSELSKMIEFDSIVFIRKGPRRKHFSRLLIIFNSEVQASTLLAIPSFQLCGSPATIRLVPEPEALKIERESKTKLYVGNLPKSANNLDLWNHFKQFGKLAYSYVITSPKTRKSKGFGFVIFDKRAGMDKALAKSGQRIKGRLISMKPFLNKSQIKRANALKSNSKGVEGLKQPQNKQEEPKAKGDAKEESASESQVQSNLFLTKSNPEKRQEKLKIPNMEFDGDSLLKSSMLLKKLRDRKTLESNVRFNPQRRNVYKFSAKNVLLLRRYRR